MSNTIRTVTLIGAACVAAAAPLLSATCASAASIATWDAVAQCESSGNWANADTGHTGHWGGLQFSQSSWAAAGGLQYAARADYATKDQQIAVAEKLLAMQGPGAWQCASAGGLTAGGPVADVHPTNPVHSNSSLPANPAPPAEAVPIPAPALSQAQVPHGNDNERTHTVRSGDTLSRIAQDHHVAGGWHELYELNKSSVPNPNLIFPGQQLRLA